MFLWLLKIFWRSTVYILLYYTPGQDSVHAVTVVLSVAVCIQAITAILSSGSKQWIAYYSRRLDGLEWTGHSNIARLSELMHLVALSSELHTTHVKQFRLYLLWRKKLRFVLCIHTSGVNCHLIQCANYTYHYTHLRAKRGANAGAMEFSQESDYFRSFKVPAKWWYVEKQSTVGFPIGDDPYLLKNKVRFSDDMTILGHR